MPYQYDSGTFKPRRVSVARFRAEFNVILTHEEEVVITNKGKVVGHFHSLDIKRLEQRQWRGMMSDDFLANLEEILLQDSDQRSIIILQEGLTGGYFMFRRKKQPRLQDRFWDRLAGRFRD